MVQFQNSVLNYFDTLIFVIFEDEYFGFVESSEQYINRIVDFIHSNIDSFPSKKTPIQLQKFGRNYIFYKINPRTTWYIFFVKYNNDYFVTHLMNNHCEDANYL